MNHDLLKELPELYVLGALPEQERRALKAHLLTCLDCAAAVRDLQRLTEALGSLVEPIDPPAGLRDRVLSVALKEAQEPAQPEKGNPPSSIVEITKHYYVSFVGDGVGPTVACALTQAAMQLEGAALIAKAIKERK